MKSFLNPDASNVEGECICGKDSCEEAGDDYSPSAMSFDTSGFCSV
jgi:hypothetical protein